LANFVENIPCFQGGENDLSNRFLVPSHPRITRSIFVGWAGRNFWKKSCHANPRWQGERNQTSHGFPEIFNNARLLDRPL